MKRMRRKFKAMQRDINGRSVDWRTLYLESKEKEEAGMTDKKKKKKARDKNAEKREKERKKRCVQPAYIHPLILPSRSLLYITVLYLQRKGERPDQEEAAGQQGSQGQTARREGQRGHHGPAAHQETHRQEEQGRLLAEAFISLFISIIYRILFYSLLHFCIPLYQVAPGSGEGDDDSELGLEDVLMKDEESKAEREGGSRPGAVRVKAKPATKGGRGIAIGDVNDGVDIGDSPLAVVKQKEASLAKKDNKAGGGMSKYHSHSWYISIYDMSNQHFQ
jgi:hypothetical protein